MVFRLPRFTHMRSVSVLIKQLLLPLVRACVNLWYGIWVVCYALLSANLSIHNGRIENVWGVHAVLLMEYASRSPWYQRRYQQVTNWYCRCPPEIVIWGFIKGIYFSNELSIYLKAGTSVLTGLRHRGNFSLFASPQGSRWLPSVILDTVKEVSDCMLNR